MKTGKMKWFGKAAGAGVLALTMAAPALQAQTFGGQRGWNRNQTQERSQNQGAQDRIQNRSQYDRSSNQGQYGQPRQNDRSQQGQFDRNQSQSFDRSRSVDRTSRDNQRFSVDGRITSLSRERDGYRVQLDRGRDSYWVPQTYFRGSAPRVGLSIGFGGIFGGGAFSIDAVNLPGVYAPAYQSALVEGVIQRIDVRDGRMLLQDRDGQLITVDAGAAIRGLQPGDYVELTGGWVGGGVFQLTQIDNVVAR